MKKNINLRKLISFALVGLMSCGNLSASESNITKKKKSSSSPILPVVGTIGSLGVVGVGVGAAVAYCTKTNNEKTDSSKQHTTQTPIEYPKPNVPNVKEVAPKVPDNNKTHNLVDITKITKTKIDDVYLWKGDITTLKVDAIVNAAKSSLLGGDGVDGAIHKAAGPQLLEECKGLKGCETGEAKITKGYNLPAKYVIHTVGPIVSGALTDEDRNLLASCYKSSLELADKKNLNSIAFCCISTGYYGFPHEEAAKIAIETVQKYKTDTKSKINIIFDVFENIDESIYKKILL